MEEYQSFQLKYQRDINKALDSDKHARKRGLQNLLDSLPWMKISEKENLEKFITNDLINVLYSTLCDTVEKCRELSLKLLQKISETNSLVFSQHFEKLILALSERIGNLPFPEVSEELRYSVIQAIHSLLSYRNNSDVSSQLMNKVFSSCGKALHDNFSNAKRATADLITEISMKWPELVGMSYKVVIPSLIANGLHQHSKTRVATLKVNMKCKIGVKNEQFINVL